MHTFKRATAVAALVFASLLTLGSGISDAQSSFVSGSSTFGSIEDDFGNTISATETEDPKAIILENELIKFHTTAGLAKSSEAEEIAEDYYHRALNNELPLLEDRFFADYFDSTNVILAVIPPEEIDREIQIMQQMTAGLDPENPTESGEVGVLVKKSNGQYYMVTVQIS
ncbi:putative secreted protein [Corynebacterium deserti GIMN1.010]|uniref:Putative secreted protein n=1 Tax=Corynebacterium deserti GIMN1.010 TaxID=931089 RepID=A0A0M3Q919_9CORY|nr:hypothetical protein [Corynebacterium deserti]ALC04843.1 putative secreted protein [Corynebacterium deserti GIMN1.010]